ncbi:MULTISPECIES: DUF998 domain-containing protein [Thermocrispum]|jgi:hypothetical protein|uniref:DUF998 domain-containing protein n=1 Tax=Thermocrispum agreste TaxID=37925 RepID=A0A2W4JM50_9PSEU|nr:MULTISPECIES: DUF998 domain-containing protein [Thermocrispum]PZN00173.1 MAG: DUF998 domain-containing protein [Thermocrispum agreste]
MANIVAAPVSARSATAPVTRSAWPHPLAVGRLLGMTGVIVAFVFMLLLHLLAGAAIQPVTETLSGAVFAPGVGWMFPAGVTSMAVAGLGVAVVLHGSGLPVGRVAMVGAWLTTVGLVLVTLFPTDRVGAGSISAQIHRYAAAVALLAVPVVALLVARLLGHGKRMLQAAAWFVVVVLVLTGVAIFLPGVFDPVRGVIQRVLLVGELVVLAQLIHLTVRAAVRSDRPVLAANRETSSTAESPEAVTATSAACLEGSAV